MVLIRQAHADDAHAISELLLDLSLEFIVHEFSDEGKRYFQNELSPARLTERLAGDFRFYLAEDEGQLAGVAAIRGNTHLYFLFVAKPYQGQGLARRLWNRVRSDSLERGNPGRFTVHASNYAMSVYQRLGFIRSGFAQQMHGVIYNPMEYDAERASAAF